MMYKGKDIRDAYLILSSLSKLPEHRAALKILWDTILDYQVNHYQNNCTHTWNAGGYCDQCGIDCNLAD